MFEGASKTTSARPWSRTDEFASQGGVSVKYTSVVSFIVTGAASTNHKSQDEESGSKQPRHWGFPPRKREKPHVAVRPRVLARQPLTARSWAVWLSSSWQCRCRWRPGGGRIDYAARRSEIAGISRMARLGRLPSPAPYPGCAGSVCVPAWGKCGLFRESFLGTVSNRTKH